MDLSDNADNDNSKIFVLYGSETGTARNYARILWKKLRSLGVKCQINSLDNIYLPSIVEWRLCIFIVSTTGQGDPPTNMKNFWKHILRKSLPMYEYLGGLKFAVLGLGDSSYLKYNYCAKILYKRLIQLGATSFTDIGLADDQDATGPNYEAIPWIKNCINYIVKDYLHLSIEFKHSDPYLDLFPDNYIPTFNLTYCYDDQMKFCKINPNVCDKDAIPSYVLKNERITAENYFNQVNRLTFQIIPPSNNKQICPGDVVMIKPKNSLTILDDFYKLIHSSVKQLLTRTYKIDINDAYDEKPSILFNTNGIGNIFTFEYLLYNYFDLTSVPKQDSFMILYFISKNSKEKERLLEIATDYDDYLDYCYRPKKTFVEVCLDFYNTAKDIQLEHFFDLLCPIVSRSYSIATIDNNYHSLFQENLVTDKLNISIIVSKNTYKTNMPIPRIGLCSGYLCDRLVPGCHVDISIRPGTLKFGEFRKPKILVGAGTGCAPFCFYVNRLLSACSNSTNYSEYKQSNIIFLGFRKKMADFLLNNIWIEAVSHNVCELFVAFSRDQPNKVYVQHLIKEKASLVYEFIKNMDAQIIVCGNGKNTMAECVKKAFIDVIHEKSNPPMDKLLAADFIKKMEKLGLYQEEVW